MDNTPSANILALKLWLGTGSINVFGLPFSGKDTHGSRLAETFDALMLGGGDILRNSVIPDHVQKDMESGRLIPTDDYIRIVLPYLSSDQFTGRPLILSSVGRWKGEEPGVMMAANTSNHPLKAAVFLSVSEETAHKRYVKSQVDKDRGMRADDTSEDILQNRFSEFRNKTLPVIDFYRDIGILIEVDGNPPKDAVFQSILDGLSKLASQSSK